ncbi:MAG: hypothetical protein AAFX09_02740 [Pseudomonadota bacterium]
MLTVSDRVHHCIDLMAKGQVEFALEQACIAIDVTSKRFFNLPRSEGKRYKDFIENYSFIIELMALQGVDLEKTQFSNMDILDYKGSLISEPKISDLIYHLMRCNLIHDTGLPKNVRLLKGNRVYLGANSIVLPEAIVWGLLAIVVFCPANEDEHSCRGYFLSCGENYRWVIDQVWGMEDLVQEAFKAEVTTRVWLKDLADIGTGDVRLKGG